MRNAIATACFGVIAFIAFPAHSQSPTERIQSIAAQSDCASVNWPNRGRAPKAYMRGVALVFAKAVCQPDRADVKVVAAARQLGSVAERSDALAWYDADFEDAGMPNKQSGLDTLRHAYTLLISLGMQESSGKYCVGRDMSAGFSTAESAEAGPFQTSWGVHVADPTLGQMFEAYKADPGGCGLEVFKQSVRCSQSDAVTWGDGEGADWQRLTKACPVFATEYAAVALRKSGGSRGEFGPIRHRQAEIEDSCDAMLSEVQRFVQSDPQACAALTGPAPK
jgi:hypothetical protein